jgi:hypothetical protein
LRRADSAARLLFTRPCPRVSRVLRYSTPITAAPAAAA